MPAPFGVLSPGEEAAEGPNFLDKLVAGIINGTVTLPERVIKATQATAPGLRREDFTDIPGAAQPGAEMREGAMEAAFNLAGISAPFAQVGAAGVFGGRLAKTADKAALATAEEMAAKGADRKEIWDKTGWFKGGDDKWRFEIPDDKAVFNPNVYGGPGDKMPERGQFGPVAAHLWHKDLYAAYPDARRITAYTNDGPVGGSWQAPQAGDRVMMGSDEAVKVRAPFVEDAKQVALHEMQHAIQAREGFAQGGSPTMFKQGQDAILSRDALSWRQEMARFSGTPAQKDAAAEKAYREMGAVDWMPSKEAREIAKYTDDNPDDVLKSVVNLYGVDKQTTPYSPQELYRALPGEIEARNVERRANMTRDELRAKPPWETEHWMDRAATSPTLERIFGSGRVGMLEGGKRSSAAQMSAPAMDAAAVARARPDGMVSQNGNIVVSKRGDELIAELDGKRVGSLNLSWRGPYATSITVEGGARRQGVATQLYNAAESVLGRSMIPSPLGLSDEAMKLWKRRLSEVDPAVRQQILKEAAQIGADAGVGKSAAERMRKLGMAD